MVCRGAQLAASAHGDAVHGALLGHGRVECWCAAVEGLVDLVRLVSSLDARFVGDGVGGGHEGPGVRVIPGSS